MLWQLNGGSLASGRRLVRKSGKDVQAWGAQRVLRGKSLVGWGFCGVLGGCIEPSETARVALGAKGIPIEPAAFVAAAALGQIEAMRLLEQAGVSASAVDPASGYSALTAAIDAGQEGAFEYLIAGGADLRERDPEGRTPLKAALRGGRYGMAEKLLEVGADPNEPLVEGGRSPLEEAVANGDGEAVNLLLRFGADPGVVSGAGQLLGRAPVTEGVLARLEALRGPGKAGEPGSQSEGEALERAIGRGMFRSAEMLVERGASAGEIGVEELLEAVADGDLQRVRRLLHLGADPDGAGPAGETALEWAVSGGDLEAAEILLEWGGDPSGGLRAAVASGDRRMVRLLLDWGARPDGAGENGEGTALSLAVGRSDKDVAGWLVAAGADPAVPGAMGQPPLLVAAAGGDTGMIEELVSGGADPDIRSAAPHGPDFRALVTTKTLDFYLRNDTGLTALMVAAAQDDVPSLEALLGHGATKWHYTGKYKRYAVNFAAERGHIYNQQRLLGRDPLNETVKRKIVVDLSDQQAKLYENGKVVLTSRVSTGKKGFRTPAGEYVISNKYKNWTSTIYDSPMPYFQRLSFGAFGFHVGYVPNYPASHGCIRMPRSSAIELFSKTSVGDLVSIVP